MKILVCEDDTETRHLIETMLKTRDYDYVITDRAISACEALDLAKENDAPFDLIITDIGMTGESGFYLAGYARGIGYEGPIAALTAYEPDAIMGSLLTVSAEYWPKPAAMGNFIERIESFRPHAGDENSEKHPMPKRAE